MSENPENKKFTSIDDVVAEAEKLSVEAVGGPMDIHGGTFTRVWADEFHDGLRGAVEYIANAISGPKQYRVEYADTGEPWMLIIEPIKKAKKPKSKNSADVERMQHLAGINKK